MDERIKARARRAQDPGDRVVAAAEERRRLAALPDDEFQAELEASTRKTLEQSARQRRENRARRKRPAEKVGLSGGAIVVLARAVGVEDPDVLAALGAVAAAAPALVTGLIAHGGLRGVFRAVVGK